MEVMRYLSGATDLDRLLRFWTKHTPEGSDGLPLDLFVQAFLYVFERNGTFQPKDVHVLRSTDPLIRSYYPDRWKFVLQVIAALLEAFRDIDVNGDSQIEWHELTAYIAYAGVIALKKTAGVYARGQYQERNAEWRDTGVDPHGRGVGSIFVVEWPFEYEGLLYSPTSSYYPHSGGKGPCRFDGTPAIDPTGAVDYGNQSGDSTRRAIAMRHYPMELFVVESGSTRLRILDAGSREAASERGREPIEGLRYMEKLTSSAQPASSGAGGTMPGTKGTESLDAEKGEDAVHSRAGFHGSSGAASSGDQAQLDFASSQRQVNSKRTGPFADERGRRSIRYPGAVISACASLRFKYEVRADSPAIEVIARQEASRPSDVVALRRSAMAGDPSGSTSFGSADLQMAMLGVGGSRGIGISPKVYMPTFEDTMRMLAPSANLVASVTSHGARAGGADGGTSEQGQRGGGLMTEALEAAAHLRRRRRLEQQGKYLGLLTDAGGDGIGKSRGSKKGSRSAAAASRKKYQLKSLLRASQTHKSGTGAGSGGNRSQAKPPQAAKTYSDQASPSINSVCPLVFQPNLNAARMQAGVEPVSMGPIAAPTTTATSKQQRKRLQQQLPNIERGIALGQSDGRITLWRLPKGAHLPLSDSVFDPKGIDAARKSAYQAQLASEVDDILKRGHRTGEVLARVRALPDVTASGAKVPRGGSAEQDYAIDDKVRERTDAALAQLMLDADSSVDPDSEHNILDGASVANSKPVYRNPFVVFGVIPFRGPVAHLASALGLLYANGPAEPGYVYVYDIATRTHIHKIQVHPAPITQMLALSPGQLGVPGPVRNTSSTGMDTGENGDKKKGFLDETKTMKDLQRSLREVMSKQSSSNNADVGPAALAEAFRHAGSIKPSLAKTDRAIAVSDQDAAGRGLLVTAGLDRTLSIRELAPSLDETRQLYRNKARHLVSKARQARALEQQRARRAARMAQMTPKSRATAGDGTVEGFEDDDDGPREAESEFEREMRRQEEDIAVYKAAQSIPLVSNGGREIARVTLPRACRQAIFVPRGNLLCVAGFDTEAWAFSLPSGKLVLSLRGHHSPLVGISEMWHGRDSFGLGGASWGQSPKPLFFGKRSQGADSGSGNDPTDIALPSYVEPRVVTVDESGAFRIWDLTPVATGVAQCILTFSVQTATGSSLSQFDPRGLAAVRPTGELIVAGSRLHHFLPMTYAREDAAPALCLFNPVTKTFVVAGGSGEVQGATEGGGENEGEEDVEENRGEDADDDDGQGKDSAHAVEVEAVDGGEGNGPKDDDASTKTKKGGSLRVFSAATGAELKPLRSITRTPITAIGADDRLRKLILGTQDGGITVVNAANGALMKRADIGHRRGSEVSDLAYTDLDGDRSFVTVGWDKSMRVYDESPPHACVCLRSVVGTHKSDVLAVDYCRHPLRLVASGDATGHVYVHDHESLSEEGRCIGHEGEITGLKFIRPFPLLLSTDAGGNLVLWGVRGSGDGQQDSPCMVFRNRRDDKRGDLDRLVRVAEQRQHYLREQQQQRRRKARRKRNKAGASTARSEVDTARAEEPEVSAPKSVSTESLMLGPSVAVCSTAVGFWPFLDDGNDGIAAEMYTTKDIVDDPIERMWSRSEHPMMTEEAKYWAKAGIKADLPSGADGSMRKDPFKVKEDNGASSSDSDEDDDSASGTDGKHAADEHNDSGSSEMAKSAAARFSPMAHDPKRPWKSRCRRDARRTVVVGDEEGRIKVLDLSWMLKVVGCSPVSSANDVIGIRRSSMVALTAGKDLKELVAAYLAAQGLTPPEQSGESRPPASNVLDEPLATPGRPSAQRLPSRPAGTASSSGHKGQLAHERLAGRRRRSQQLQESSMMGSMDGSDSADPSGLGGNSGLLRGGGGDFVPVQFGEDDEEDLMDGADGEYMTAGARAALSEGVRQNRAGKGELVMTGRKTRARQRERLAAGDGSGRGGTSASSREHAAKRSAAARAEQEKMERMRHFILAADRTRSVPVLAQWMAHPGSSVVQVQCIADPPAICSCSADGSVKLWRPDGLPLGALLYSPLEAYQIRIGTMPATPWRFQLDKEVERKRREAEARRLLRVMRRRARARYETAKREAARASAMHKASTVLAKRVPQSPLLDVAKRSSGVDPGKVVQVEGDSLVNDSAGKQLHGEAGGPQDKGRPSTAGSADELARWEGIAKEDSLKIQEEKLAVQMEQEHERKVQKQLEEDREKDARMEQLKISAGLSRAGSTRSIGLGGSSPGGDETAKMEARLTHFEGSFRGFAKAREKAKSLIQIDESKAIPDGDAQTVSAGTLSVEPARKQVSSTTSMQSAGSRKYETLGVALKRMGSSRKSFHLGNRNKKHIAVQKALGELGRRGSDSDDDADGGSDSDESMQATMFSPDHKDVVAIFASKYAAKDYSGADDAIKQEKEQQDRAEQDRKAASGVFDELVGGKRGSLDEEAKQAAEAIKALGSERAAGTMLMTHLMSGNAPVIHERYYPHLMDSISKLPSGGAGQGAPSQRSSEATASATLTAAEGFGGLPVLPGRPGIPGMPLPAGFHAGGIEIGGKAASSSADESLARAAPMSSFLKLRLGEIKGTNTRSKKKKKKKRSGAGSQDGGSLAYTAPAAVRQPGGMGKSRSLFVGKEGSLSRTGTLGLGMHGVTQVSEAGGSYSTTDGIDDVHAVQGIRGSHASPLGRRGFRGADSVPALKKNNTLARSMKRKGTMSAEYLPDPGPRSDYAVDRQDDRWAQEMWIFSKSSYTLAASAIRRSKRVESSRKRVLLRWLVQASVSAGGRVDSLKGLESDLLTPVRDFRRSTNRPDTMDAIHERQDAAKAGFKQLKTGSLTLISSGEAVALETAIRHAAAEDLRCRLTSQANFALHLRGKPPSSRTKGRSSPKQGLPKPGRLPSLGSAGRGGVLIGASPSRKRLDPSGGKQATVRFAGMDDKARDAGHPSDMHDGSHDAGDEGLNAEGKHSSGRYRSPEERMAVLEHASRAARKAHEAMTKSADPLRKLKATASTPDVKEPVARRGELPDRHTGLTDREVLKAARVGGIPVGELQEAYLLFSRLDKDGSGTIDPQELLDSKVWLAPSQARVIDEARDEAARHRALEHRIALEDEQAEEGEEPSSSIGIKDVYGDAGEPPTDASRPGMLTASSRLAELLSAHASSIFRSMDTNADGEISLKEYLTALFKSKAAPTAGPKHSVLAFTAKAKERPVGGYASPSSPAGRASTSGRGSASERKSKKRHPISRWGGQQSSQQRGIREMLQWVRARQAQASKAARSGIWNQ